jgi:Uncharacterized protein conserved in bacteria (DUF2059)
MVRARPILCLIPLALLAAGPTAALAQDGAATATATPAPPPIAADRLAAARTTVNAVFPKGTYARLMEQAMGGTLNTLMGSLGDLPARDLVAATGVAGTDLENLGDATLKEMLAILDPAYEQRMTITMKAMTGQMTELMSEFEPAFQDGLARAYARRFDTAQLGELNRFFATPTGAAYASESMMLFMDPEVMSKMTELMPALLERMPRIIEGMTAATANLPQPRKVGDLTPEERAKLEALMGKPLSPPEAQADPQPE